MAATLGINMAGRVFSITGGASGMGRATAHLLARHRDGAIWIADKQTSVFDEVRKELNEINKDTKVYMDEIDVSDKAQVEAWVQRIVTKSGGLHGSANVAGIPMRIRLAGQSEPCLPAENDDEWRRIMRVNMDGVMYCTRAQVRAMLQMEKGSNPAIVNVSSMATFLHSAGGYAYQTSKAACEHFTRSAAKDVAGRGMRINGVLPGNTLTPMTKHFFGAMSDQELKTLIDKFDLSGDGILPEDVARAIVWLLSENSLTINGVSLPVGEVQP